VFTLQSIANNSSHLYRRELHQFLLPGIFDFSSLLELPVHITSSLVDPILHVSVVNVRLIFEYGEC